MSQPRLTLARLLAAVFALLCLIEDQSLQSQQPIPTASGEKRLDADNLKGDEKTIFDKLRDGNIAYAPDHKPIVEKAARWYINRVTWVEYQKRPLDSTSSQTVNDVLIDAFRQIPDVKKAPNNQVARAQQKDFLREFGKVATATIDEVLKNPMPIARINAARILARFGEAGVEETADYMVKVIQDKEQLDAVKLYAMRGLKDLFATAQLEPKGRFTKLDREQRCIQALIDFIEQTPELPKNAPTEEIDGYRYVRREAVRALGQSRVPAVVQKKEVVARPALVLVKVLSKDGITPEPSFGEQVEAAIGICQMQPKFYAGYQADYAAMHLGHFFVDFASRYGQDTKEKSVRSQPWKYNAVRLQQALEIMRGDKPDDFTKALSLEAEKTIRPIETDKFVQPNALMDWLRRNKPKSSSVYKGDEASAVKLPASSDN